MLEYGDNKLMEMIKSNVVRKLGRSKAETTNLSIMTEVQKQGTVIIAGHQEIKMKVDSIVVFADDEPKANWGHGCRYLLHDAKTGEQYASVKSSMPPYIIDIPKSFQAFHKPVNLTNPLEFRKSIIDLSSIYIFPRIPKGTRYAILYSGASDNRHTNDLEFLYRQLVQKYLFNPANITVLNYDGTVKYKDWSASTPNWPGDNTPYTMPVNGSGTKANFVNAIDALKPKLKADDFLLIHTNNHGSHNGTESYIYTYPGTGPHFYASQFGQKLAELPVYANLMVMMEQCNSGGFNDIVIEKSTAKKTTFAAAATEGRSSIGGAYFDPFAHDWIAALANKTAFNVPLSINPDSNANNIVSSREAFDYAEEVHDPYDSPVFTSYGEKASQQKLYQEWTILWRHWDRITLAFKRLDHSIGNADEFRTLVREKIIPELGRIDDLVVAKKLDEKEAQYKITEVFAQYDKTSEMAY